DLVRGYWTAAYEGTTTETWTLRDTAGNTFPSFDAFWRQALHDGFITGTARATAATEPAPPIEALAPSAATTGEGIDIVFRPDPYLLDGRYANNAWLQELPRPLTKVTWDAVAHLSL